MKGRKVVFFCSGDDTSETLISARTVSIDKTVREYAVTLQDRVLLGELSEGDMHALDARYHSKCLLRLHNRLRVHLKKQNNSSTATKRSLDVVLSELVFFIEAERENPNLPISNCLNSAKCMIVTNGIRSTPELGVLAPFVFGGVWPWQ